MLPTMKKDKCYTVLCAINKEDKYKFPAGECQTCIHLLAMLHALECLFEAQHKAVLVGTALGEPRTSFECSCIKPRKRKVPATSANDLHYTKHMYGKTRKENQWTWTLPPSKRGKDTIETGRQILRMV